MSVLAGDKTGAMEDCVAVSGVADSRTTRAYSYYLEPYDETRRPEKFLEVMAALLRHSTYGHWLELYSKVTTKCSRCAEVCPVYDTTGDPHDIPCYRTELILKVYRRYFTFSGMLRARLGRAWELTDQHIDEMAESIYHCTACRRCNIECPLGIDHALMTHLMRHILTEIGVVPKALVVAVREQLEGPTRNTSAIPVAAMADTCEFLEEELVEQFKYDQIKFPIDIEGAEYVFFPAVSDFLLEADTLMGNAAVFHATGCSWTIGSHNFDGINYGLFVNDRFLRRIIQQLVAEVGRLRGVKIMIGECGHASRSAKDFVPVFGGSNPPEVVNCMEWTYRALEEGRLKLNPEIITDVVTYHDPCNIARRGWIVDQPREILRSFCKNFVEMTPNRKYNYCCGGGGGTVSIDEIREYRTGVGGKKKADQLRATGSRYVVAPCANCKKQLREIVEDHHLEDVEVVGLHDLILKAIEIPGAKPAAERAAAQAGTDWKGEMDNA
ncbi:MAG: (Fe-S)-binding protein [Acidobacteriota bacterium]